MRLADHVDFVIGVDTHKQSHTLGLVTGAGTEVEDVTFATDAFGYKRMLAWVQQRTGDPDRRCWGDRRDGKLRVGAHYVPSRAR